MVKVSRETPAEDRPVISGTIAAEPSPSVVQGRGVAYPASPDIFVQEYGALSPNINNNNNNVSFVSSADPPAVAQEFVPEPPRVNRETPACRLARAKRPPLPLPKRHAGVSRSTRGGSGTNS